MGKSKLEQYNILLVGGKSVGLYSLREQYLKGWIAPKDFSGPSGSNFKVETIDGQKYEIAITCAKDLGSIDEQIDCHGVFMVYNISDKQSLEYVKSSAFPELVKKFGKATDDENENVKTDEENKDEAGTTKTALKIPTVLVGNKVDEEKLSRAVETPAGESLSKELLCIGFYETSATCNVNITQSFRCLAEEIVKLNQSDQPEQAPSKSCCIIL